MKKELENIKFAKKAAKENNLIYAPDDAALVWMNRFSEIIRMAERDRCVHACEKAGFSEAAKFLREM
jgi:hypothetical protein